MTLKELQAEVREWRIHKTNFGDDPTDPLLGVMEEVGELTHAHLKMKQGIRKNEDHYRGKIDAVGDILIYLADYCDRNGLDLSCCLTMAWGEVKERNWKTRDIQS